MLAGSSAEVAVGRSCGPWVAIEFQSCFGHACQAADSADVSFLAPVPVYRELLPDANLTLRFREQVHETPAWSCLGPESSKTEVMQPGSSSQTPSLLCSDPTRSLLGIGISTLPGTQLFLFIIVKLA